MLTWRAFCHFVRSFLSFFLLVGQIISSDSRFIKIILNFRLPGQVRRAAIFDCKAKIRERRGALLFALSKESAAKMNRRRFRHLTFL